MYSNPSVLNLSVHLIVQRVALIGLLIALLPSFASGINPAPAAAESAHSAGFIDSDSDGIDDNLDNCVLVANADQRDADGDGIGSLCDQDLDQNCVINFGDVAAFAAVFQTSNANADFDNSGAVNFGDYVLLTNAFLSAPGPSGIPNICQTSLTLFGTVPDVLDAPALVTARVDSTSGGGSITEYTTTTSADGSYSIVVDGASDDDFITLLVAGAGSQSAIHLTSLAGTKSALAAAGGNDGTVDGTEVDALNISTLTTTYAVLAEEALGSTINEQSELQTSENRVDASLMLRYAAVLDLMISNPAISVPAGFSDSIAWLNDTQARAEYVIKVRVNFPSELATAEHNSVTGAQPQYDSPSLPETLYLTLINNLFSSYDGAKAEFSNPGTVLFKDIELNESAPWSIDANGDIVILFAPAFLVGTYTQFIDDPDNPGNQVETTVEIYRDQIKIYRLRAGLGSDHAVITRSGFTTYPEYPVLGDESYIDEVGSEQARVVPFVVPDFAFDAADLVANGMAGVYYHRDNQALGVANADAGDGFDILDFSADGTGSTRRRGFAFDWIIQNHELLITFNNGDSNRYRHLFDIETGVSNALVSSVTNGTNTTRRTILIQPDESLAFTAANIQDKSYRHGLATSNTLLPDTNLFDFVFYPANVACRNPGSSAQTWNWSIADDRVELYRNFNFPPPDEHFFSNRTWQPIRQADNRVYVIETLEFAGDFMMVPPTDAAVTPGRVNMYTLSHVAVGSSLPLITDDFFTTPVNTPINLFISDIISNDLDFEGDEVIVRTVGTPANGFINFFSGGTYPYSIEYTPAPGFVGTDVFTYEGSDFACLGPTPNSGTISVTVN